MRLIYKQLYKQMVKDPLFLCLLFLLVMLTSMSFFFVMYAVDGNLAVLQAQSSLTKNQQLYQNALQANTILAYQFLAGLMVLTSLVFVMYFYRFFRGNQKQIGCIKALGFQDRFLQLLVVGFTGSLSFLASLAGLFAGYFLSDILLKANSKTYLVTGLVKQIGAGSLLAGLGLSTAVFCVVTYCCYGFIKKREVGFLLTGNHQPARFSLTLKIADQVSRILPPKHRLSLRIALRKPLSVLLLLAAVMSFGVCIILGQSLHYSSARIFANQTMGRHYQYQVGYESYQTEVIPGNPLVYLESPATVLAGNYKIERVVTGLYASNELYQLINPHNQILLTPDENTVYINPEFSEIYGVKIGDNLMVDIMGKQQSFTVKDIAVNADTNHVYVNGGQLSGILGAPEGAYNGAYSINEIPGDSLATKAQLMEGLKRNAVSNQISAVINQSVGVFVGAILIVLALYISFQDNTHDMLILRMIGYPGKGIGNLLLDVYLPVLWFAFFLTLAPSIVLAQGIQRSLSISTNDYMPFGINLYVIFTAFLAITFIYWVVKTIFGLVVETWIAKREVTEILYRV